MVRPAWAASKTILTLNTLSTQAWELRAQGKFEDAILFGGQALAEAARWTGMESEYQGKRTKSH